MQLIDNIVDTRALCRQWRQQGLRIAFVPTMGCLHEGHLSLVDKAREVADQVVVSIFVNPLQFNNPDDLQNYPRTLEADLQKLGERNVQLVFAPSNEDFYPPDEPVEEVDPGEISTLLEGEFRPGHFAGVATVVKRLFDIVQPDFAIFGEKDFQQLIVVRQLVARFGMPIEIIGMPTRREADGLAMSSRNVRLTAGERQTAALIYQQMCVLRQAILDGEQDYPALEQNMITALVQAGFEPEYVVVRQAETLMPVTDAGQSRVILVAARLGRVRLIDNLRV